MFEQLEVQPMVRDTFTDASMGSLPVPRPPLARSTATLLAQARGVLGEAEEAETASERFRLAHLSALRSAAAVLADRARPSAKPRRVRSAWVLLDSLAPEWRDWAAYFASGASVREAIEAGAVGAVSARDADDELRAAGEFLQIIEESMGRLPVSLAS